MPNLLIFVILPIVVSTGPEGESSEVCQGVDLRGSWCGTEYYTHKITPVEMQRSVVRIVRHGIHLRHFDIDLNEAHFEGENRVRFTRYEIERLGIYKQEGDVLTIAFSTYDKGWPRSYRVSDDVVVIVLHRRGHALKRKEKDRD